MFWEICVEQKKIAVCISGAFRGNYKIVLDNIYTNLINPLNADVFISTWDNHYVFPGYQRTGSPLIYRTLGKHIELHTPEILKREEFFRQVFPKTYSKLCNPIICKLDAEDILNHYKVTELSIVSENAFHNLIQPKLDVRGWRNLNQYKMFYLLYKCNELKNCYKKCSNCSYDIVIRIRPDLFFLKQINLAAINEIDNNEIYDIQHQESVDDAFFCATETTMDKIVSLWDLILRSGKLSPFKTHKFRSHILLYSWLLYNDIKVKSIDNRIYPRDHSVFDLQKCLDGYIPDLSSELLGDINLLKSNHNVSDLTSSNDFQLISDWVDFVLESLKKHISPMIKPDNEFCDNLYSLSNNKNDVNEICSLVEHKICFVCPTYPPRYEYAKQLLKSFKDNHLDEQADLYFIFSNEDDSLAFGDYPFKIILPNNTFASSRDALRKGIVTTKIFYGISTVYKEYEYAIRIDDDSLFIKNVNLKYLCDRFYSEKVLLGNKTSGTDLVKNIIHLSQLLLTKSENLSVASDLYFWFTQPCIFKSDLLDTFFEIINLKDNLFKFRWEQFDFVIFGYYLILYHGFLIVDACCPSVFSFTESKNITRDMLPQIKEKVYQCRKEILPQLDNSNLFMLIHVDRK